MPSWHEYEGSGGERAELPAVRTSDVGHLVGRWGPVALCEECFREEFRQSDVERERRVADEEE
jgi:hypothetical protein